MPHGLSSRRSYKMDDNKNVRKILDKAFWDGVLKLRNDMLNAYKKEMDNGIDNRLDSH